MCVDSFEEKIPTMLIKLSTTCMCKKKKPKCVYILIKAFSFLTGHFLELTSSKCTWTCGKIYASV